jgi:catechol 2,3-dioxygenase-like lactoylglutathione lyase family enzyme
MHTPFQRNEHLFDAPRRDTSRVSDERPAVWVGHVSLGVSDLDRAVGFWTGLGMREIERNPHVAVLELRGGTHLVLLPGAVSPARGADVPFDLMVDDLDATHAAWDDEGMQPTTIERGRIHNSFSVADPDGRVLTVSSSHVVGPV